jgi:hypothetical protein
MTTPFHLSYSIPNEIVVQLKQEAAELDFVHVKSKNFGIRLTENRITSPFDYASTRTTGQALAIANSASLIRTCEQLVGKTIRLDACNFLLYSKGAFIGLHTDRPGCEVNALFLIAGPPTVVELRPRTEYETIRDLLRLSKAGDGIVDGTLKIGLPHPGASVIFLSGQVPHQRRHTDYTILLLSICYGIAS